MSSSTSSFKKVLSFSLWGNTPKYTVGAIRNAELAKNIYPEFECWFYIHKDTVPSAIVETLSNFSNVKIIFKEGSLSETKPMCWRFESISSEDVEVMMPRDTDSRISMREKLAVDEWLKSDYLLHIMRDHKIHHIYKIFGGMFGIKKYKDMPDWKKMINEIDQNGEERMYDLKFLNEMISGIPRDKVLAHTSGIVFSNEICKKFPTEYDENFNFVGCYVDENENRNEEHHNLLKNESTILGVVNAFDFFPHRDQPDNDLFRHPSSSILNSPNLLGCMKIAMNNSKCAGFNTLGFFKSHIDVSKLIRSNYFGPFDGLYVKKNFEIDG